MRCYLTSRYTRGLSSFFLSPRLTCASLRISDCETLRSSLNYRERNVRLKIYDGWRCVSLTSLNCKFLGLTFTSYRINEHNFIFVRKFEILTRLYSQLIKLSRSCNRRINPFSVPLRMRCMPLLEGLNYGHIWGVINMSKLFLFATREITWMPLLIYVIEMF